MSERDETSYRLALFCVVSMPLIAGGVRAWSALPFAIVSAIALGLAWTRLARAPLVLIPLGLCALSNALLVLPVPEVVARAASPETEALRRFVWEPLGAAAPKWAGLAVNPAVAGLDAVRAWSTLGLGLVVAERARRRAPTSGVLVAIAACAVLQAVVVNVIGFSDPTRGLVLSTFVNRNHQAAFFNLAWPAALAAALLVRNAWLRALAMLSLCVAIVGVIASLSRAGIASAAIGAVVLAVFLLRKRSLAWVCALAALVFALAVFAYSERLIARAAFRSEEKTRVWAQAFALAKERPLGTGRGGFGLAFNAVREPDRERGRWDYVENEYLQALVDYGVVGGTIGIALLLASFAWLVRAAWRARGRPRVKYAAVAAMASMLAVHALFDFNWELLGVSLPFWLALASLGGPTIALPRTALVLGTTACVALLGFTLRHDPDRLDARSLVRDRPLDSWALVQLAHEALDRRDVKSAALWLNRAVLTDRDWAEPHLLLAELLCRADRDAQGRAEVHQALRRTSGDHARVFSVLERCVKSDEDALAFIDDLEAPWLSALLERWAANEQRMLMLGRALKDELRDPEALRPLLAAARRAGDTALFFALARVEHPIVWIERAERLFLEGNPEAALMWLGRAAEATPAPRGAGERYVEALLRLGRLDEAERATDLLGRECQERFGACRPLHVTRARVFAARAKHTQALFEYKLVLARDPRDVAVVLLATDELIALGEPKRALDLLTETARLIADSRLEERGTRIRELGR